MVFYPWNKRPGESSDNGQWGYDHLGLFRDQQEIDNYVKQNNITQVFGVAAQNLKPGMLYYRDIRGALKPDGTFAGPDGIIDNNDQIQLSKKASNHYGFGVTLRLGYKSFAFDAVLSGSRGGRTPYNPRGPRSQPPR